MKTKTKMKNKSKTENENKNKNGNENENENKIGFLFLFSFWLSFHFCFWFCFLKVFAFLLTHVFRFWPEILFLGKFGPKNQNGQFIVKLDTWTNSDMHNSMVKFTFFVFGRKYPFFANLVQNVKIISLSWNLVASLIQICKIQWCCSNSECVLKQMYQECSMRVTKVADSPIFCDKTENTSLFMWKML